MVITVLCNNNLLKLSSFLSQQLYQRFTDFDVRFYLYELLKVAWLVFLGFVCFALHSFFFIRTCNSPAEAETKLDVLSFLMFSSMFLSYLV